MTFYEIELKSIPKILFCGDITVENYKNTFHNKKDFLELSLVLEGEFHRIYKDKTQKICSPKMFDFINEYSDFETIAVAGKIVRHKTVGVSVEYSCVKREISDFDDIDRLKRDIVEKGIILVPDMVVLEEYYEKANSILQETITAKMSNNPRYVLYSVYSLYKLFALLTEFCLDRIEKNFSAVSSNALTYVEKTKKYIEEHYNEKLTISDIALKIGVSEGYIQDIFKKVTGITVLKYLNRHRVEIFIRYVEDYRLNLANASALVGVEDPAYMSRLFKNIKGISFRAYFEKNK